MPAYVIALINVTSSEGYTTYRDMAPPTIAQYGGRYLARAGRQEVLEGEADANRFVILEFETYEKAVEWFNSPEYEEAKPFRRASSTAQILLVEGVK